MKVVIVYEEGLIYGFEPPREGNPYHGYQRDVPDDVIEKWKDASRNYEEAQEQMAAFYYQKPRERVVEDLANKPSPRSTIGDEVSRAFVDDQMKGQ